MYVGHNFRCGTRTSSGKKIRWIYFEYWGRKWLVGKIKQLSFKQTISDLNMLRKTY